MARGIARAALACAAVLLALLAFELGYRLHTERPVLVLDDWRAGRIAYRTFGDRGMFDPVLGWAPQAGYESHGYSTITAGIRRNGNETAIRTRGILAVGDVFTDGGTEVADGETWPAQLEKLTGVPVLNAGVMGYGPDQVTLRAERLLPLVQPRTLVVGLVDAGIPLAGMSSFGLARPHFTLEGDELVYHAPVPMPLYEQDVSGWRAKVRDILGYSAVLDVVISYLWPRYWIGRAGELVYETVDSEPTGVTCALLRRLKARTDAAEVRLVLLMHYERESVEQNASPGEEAAKVLACAAAMGTRIVDLFGPLRALAAADAAGLAELYLPEDTGQGHMSSKGNHHTAGLIARALGEKPGGVTPGR
jgi:hypothetical protein